MSGETNREIEVSEALTKFTGCNARQNPSPSSSCLSGLPWGARVYPALLCPSPHMHTEAAPLRLPTCWHGLAKQLGQGTGHGTPGYRTRHGKVSSPSLVWTGEEGTSTLLHVHPQKLRKPNPGGQRQGQAHLAQSLHFPICERGLLTSLEVEGTASKCSPNRHPSPDCWHLCTPRPQRQRTNMPWRL